MKCILAFALIAVLVIADGKIIPTANVENQQTTFPQLTDQIKDAQEAISKFGAEIQQKLNLPSQDELMNTLKEQSANFANNVQEYVKTVSEEVKARGPEMENLWASVKNKFTEMADKLNVNPETTEQVNQLRAKFQEGIQTIVAESNNAAKAFSENSGKVQEDIAKFTKQALDIAVQASQNLNNQLQQAAQTSPQA